MIECYEIPNTFCPDMPLDEQIANGCNDWTCEGPAGKSFGKTEKEARENYERGMDPRQGFIHKD